MKTKELAIVAVRVFAIWTLLQCIVLFEQIPIYFFSPSYSSDSYTRYLSFINIFNVVLYLGVGLSMLYKTDKVAALLTKGINDDENIGINTTELAILGFGLIGLIVFIDGTEKVAHQLITYFSRPEINMGVEVIQRRFNKSIFATGMIKMALGIVLLISPAGLVKALKWSREAGKERKNEV
jgi:hypothetical protein